jgi:hypothetical protein
MIKSRIMMGEMRHMYELEGKRPLGRPRCRWEDNIEMNLRKMGLNSVTWIHLVQDRDR